MKSQARVSFSWRPEPPTTSFVCAVVTEQEALPRRAYAIAVSATDAQGGVIDPVGANWTYSSALKSFYRYTPETPDSGTAVLKPWRSDVFLEAVEITVVAWLPDDESPDIAAVSFAAEDEANEGGRTWTIIRHSAEEVA